MSSLRRSVRAYIWLVSIVGMSAVALACVFPLVHVSMGPWEVLLFLVLAALTGDKTVQFVRTRAEKEAGSLSLLFPISLTAMLHFGPMVGILVAAVGSLSAGLFPRRRTAHVLLFDLALAVLPVWPACAVFLHINGGTLDLGLNRSFPALTAACLVCYAVDTGGGAVMEALGTSQHPWRLWRQKSVMTAPSYFAGTFLSAVVLFIFQNHIGSAVLFLGPVGYLIYQLYAVYVSRAEEKQQHIEELQVSRAHLADLYLATIKSLALAIDAKDKYTHQHILRVQRYSVATATFMGLNGSELEGLNTGALLHDIGKLGVPEYVLLKPGRLTDDEFAKIQQHPEIGAAILDPVEFPWPVLPVVRCHHEKWDGTGYPDKLAGHDIPLNARILAVADVYDALTTSRSYRNAWDHAKALDLIIQDAGTHFDPHVVHAFLQVIDGVVIAMNQEEKERHSVDAALDLPDNGTSRADRAAEAIHRASSELWALYEVAQTLSSSLGLQETLEILSRKLEAILPGTACLFLLREEGEEALSVRTAVGVNREFFEGARTLGPDSKSIFVATSCETYLGEFDTDDLLPTSSQISQWIHLHSALIVPIVHQGTVLGTINLYHPQPDAFGPHDRQLLETIAERSAMALYNGVLFDRTRSHAQTDPLTGLFNVRYLMQYVEERCHVANGEKFALLCLDLDSFKPINDNFGHQKGDQVLQDLSRIFQDSVRPSDIVARYGGDEFLIVLHGVGADEAEAMSRRLQDAVTGYDPGLTHPKLGSLRLGVSIGFGCFPEDGQDCSGLLSAADRLMYHNKTERKLGSLAGRERSFEGDLTIELPAFEERTFRRAA